MPNLGDIKYIDDIKYLYKKIDLSDILKEQGKHYKINFDSIDEDKLIEIIVNISHVYDNGYIIWDMMNALKTSITKKTNIFDCWVQVKKEKQSSIGGFYIVADEEGDLKLITRDEYEVIKRNNNFNKDIINPFNGTLEYYDEEHQQWEKHLIDSDQRTFIK